MPGNSRTYGYGSLLGWTVGRFDWLNDPGSKVNRYWRVVEEGSAATKWPWVGQEIVGLWGPDAGTNSRPNSLMSGPLTPMGAGTDQKFVPFFSRMGTDLLRAGRAALWYLFDGGTANLDLLHGNSNRDNKRIFFWLMTRATLQQMPFVSSIVVRPVEAHNYYLKALRSFDPITYEVDAIKREFAYLLGGRDIGSSAGLKHARGLAAFDQGVAPKTGRRRGESASPSGFLPGGLATVSASVTVQDFIRNGKGQFNNGTVLDSIRNINAEVAKAFQQAVVDQVANDRSRPSTGDLEAATADRRNRYPQ